MDLVMVGLKAAARTEAPASPLSTESFEAVFELHKDAVFRLACALTDNARDAEDLFQETWLRAVRARRAGPQAGDVRSWLFTIAANLHRDGLRRKRVRRLFLLERARTMAGAEADADTGWDAGRFGSRDSRAGRTSASASVARSPPCPAGSAGFRPQGHRGISARGDRPDARHPGNDRADAPPPGDEKPAKGASGLQPRPGPGRRRRGRLSHEPSRRSNV